MTQLYIDCFGGFTSEMLLGALIDMGASVEYIKSRMSVIGIDVDILSDNVHRSGIDAVYAYVKCNSRESDGSFAGGEYACALERMREALGKTAEEAAQDICLWAACLYALDSFGITKVTCSPLSEGISSGAALIPSAQITMLLQNFSIPIRTIDVAEELISEEGVAFLGECADEFGIMPLCTIKCVGYGAGSNVQGCVNVIRTVICETDEDDIALAMESIYFGDVMRT